MKNGSLKYNRQHGFILISVLISVTMLLTSAMGYAWFARTEAKRTEMRGFILKTRSVAEICCAATALKIAADKNGYDSRTEILYSPNFKTKMVVGDYNAEISIEPLDDKIPVRGLFLPDGVTLRGEYEEAWESIWDELKQPFAAALVLDFMDKDTKQKLGGSERENNINRVVSDLSELKLLPEINDEIIYGKKDSASALDRYLTVYGKEKVNINVARQQVIAILNRQIGMNNAASVVAARIISPIKSVDDLKKIPGFPASVVSKLTNIIGFESTYFCVSIKIADISKRERNYRIFLRREGSSCKIVRWEE